MYIPQFRTLTPGDVYNSSNYSLSKELNISKSLLFNINPILLVNSQGKELFQCGQIDQPGWDDYWKITSDTQGVLVEGRFGYFDNQNPYYPSIAGELTINSFQAAKFVANDFLYWSADVNTYFNVFTYGYDPTKRIKFSYRDNPYNTFVFIPPPSPDGLLVGDLATMLSFQSLVREDATNSGFVITITFNVPDEQYMGSSSSPQYAQTNDFVYFKTGTNKYKIIGEGNLISKGTGVLSYTDVGRSTTTYTFWDDLTEHLPGDWHYTWGYIKEDSFEIYQKAVGIVSNEQYNIKTKLFASIVNKKQYNTTSKHVI